MINNNNFVTAQDFPPGRAVKDGQGLQIAQLTDELMATTGMGPVLTVKLLTSTYGRWIKLKKDSN